MGRLIKRGDDVEIRVELVDGRDESQLWGGQYNAKAVDLPLMQIQICRKLQEKLGLSSSNVELVTAGATADEELYQLYLKGRYSWNKLTRAGLGQSISYFNKAIQKDPNYALAHAGLANAYLVLGAHVVLSHAEIQFLRLTCYAQKHSSTHLHRRTANWAGYLKFSIQTSPVNDGLRT
jgi:hypothetical protein